MCSSWRQCGDVRACTVESVLHFESKERRGQICVTSRSILFGGLCHLRFFHFNDTLKPNGGGFFCLI
jgi:hypothetical protein